MNQIPPVDPHATGIRMEHMLAVGRKSRPFDTMMPSILISTSPVGVTRYRRPIGRLTAAVVSSMLPTQKAPSGPTLPSLRRVARPSSASTYARCDHCRNPDQTGRLHGAMLQQVFQTEPVPASKLRLKMSIAATAGHKGRPEHGLSENVAAPPNIHQFDFAQFTAAWSKPCKSPQFWSPRVNRP